MQQIGKIVDQSKKETIELALPLNPAYVSAARLTASSITNRMGFDIECTEDVKSAVSEACTYLIRKMSGSGIQTFKIQFAIYDKHIDIQLDCGKETVEQVEDDEYGIMMIRALMDKAEITETDDTYCIFMSKQINTKANM